MNTARQIADAEGREQTALRSLEALTFKYAAAKIALERFADEDLWALDELGEKRLWAGSDNPRQFARDALEET